MAIIKRSEAKIGSVFRDRGEALEEVAARSVCCAKCGKKLDPESPGPLVRCAACGFMTPRMLSAEEGHA